MRAKRKSFLNVSATGTRIYDLMRATVYANTHCEFDIKLSIIRKQKRKHNP